MFCNSDVIIIITEANICKPPGDELLAPLVSFLIVRTGALLRENFDSQSSAMQYISVLPLITQTDI